MNLKSAFYRTYNYLRMKSGGGQELVQTPISNIVCISRNRKKVKLPLVIILCSLVVII